MKTLGLILLIMFSSTTFCVAQKQAATLNAAQKINIRFYPNPASITLNFDFGLFVEKGYTLKIFSFLGRNISTTAVSGSKLLLNVSDYSVGVYVFQLHDGSGHIIASNKFQISR